MTATLIALSMCTFALGFAEFVAVSLVPFIAIQTKLPVSSVGMMIGAYAIGVSIGAPTLSAILSRAPRRTVLMLSMLVFASGNLATALSGSLPMLLITRLVAGLMHGVVIALASSTAAASVSSQRSGKAIANVFAGLTVALMIGVPLGTYAGGKFPWQTIFLRLPCLA
ncbi:MFS transporter [Robbsia andropogonis]|uniref:MFS transporter n=1 Tax=Robbsia andropogonis TaxID=28092 RepID=UPI0006990BBC|nr:MFS transporter [Robbsia andropogonis]